jgi:hypothetical protein
MSTTRQTETENGRRSWTAPKLTRIALAETKSGGDAAAAPAAPRLPGVTLTKLGFTIEMALPMSARSTEDK